MPGPEDTVRDNTYFLLVADLLPGHLLPRRLDQPLQLRQVVRRHCAREEGQESHDTVRFEKKEKQMKKKKQGNE